MASTSDDRLAEQQIAEQLSALAREARDDPSAGLTSLKTSRALPPTKSQSATPHYVIVCSLLAAFIGGAAWWWSSSARTAIVAPLSPAFLTKDTQEPASPKDAGPTMALFSDLAQQFQSMTHDLAALRQAVEQLRAAQENLVHNSDNVANQIKESKDEAGRNKSAIEEVKTIQLQMARESRALIDRVNTSQEQFARVIANAPSPSVISEDTKSIPENLEVVPLPRPRRPANVAQTQKTALPTRPQPKKPQPAFAWPPRPR